MQFQGTEHIFARRGKVYAYVIDPSNFSEGIPDIQSVEMVDVNTFDVVALLGISVIRSAFTIHFKVTERMPPSHLRLKGHGVSSGNAVDLDLTVELVEEGVNTALRWNAEVLASGMVATLGQRVWGTIADRFVKEVFGSVRSNLEPPTVTW